MVLLATLLAPLPAQAAVHAPSSASSAFPPAAGNGRIIFEMLGGRFFTMAPDGTDLQWLNSHWDRYNPRWSPNGERIVFGRASIEDAQGEKHQNIATMRYDGTDEHIVSNWRGSSHPAWSPDGQRIAFELNHTLWVMQADGSGKRALASGVRGPFSWSPDGTRILHEAALSHDFGGVYVTSVDAAGTFLLDHDGGEPSWSPDGSKIVFSTNSALELMNADGSNQHAILDNTYLNDESRQPSWSPDGKTIVFTVRKSLYEISPEGTDLVHLPLPPLETAEWPDWQRVPVADVADAVGSEGSAGAPGQVSFRVDLSFRSAVPGVLKVATTDETAHVGADFVAPAPSVVVPAGVDHVMVPVKLIGNGTTEPDKRFGFRVVDASMLGVSDGFATGLIQDDDPIPVVSVVDAGFAEDQQGIVTVALDHPASYPITVGLGSVDGTATAPEDYSALQRQVTFPAGSVKATVPVELTVDDVVEPDETFTVRVVDAPGSVAVGKTGTITILNDDATLSALDADIAEGVPATAALSKTGQDALPGQAPLRFSLKLSLPLSKPVTVHYATVRRTAEPGVDYDPVEGIATIPAGQPQTVVSVPVKDDSVMEPDETVGLVLSNPQNATLVGGLAIGTIHDNDCPTEGGTCI
ncbi:Calx-beta domain-containing protein [Kribbella sp. NPDC055071]